jgi:peptidoglycan-associated lipoprotein
MRIKVLGAVGALLLLAACESTPDSATNASLNGNAGYGTGSAVGTGAAGAGQVVPGTQSDLAANVGDRVFFGYDQVDLSPEARATLDRQAQWLGQYRAVTVTIEGHADERGTREYNLALAEKRANSVRNYLAARGVDANRVAVVSYGKERPANGGSNEAAWSQNRRAVTAVN